MNVSKLIATASDHVANIRNRKFLLGMTYLVGHFTLAALITLFRPEMGLLGLATLAGGLGTGVVGMVWGITKEPPASNS